MHHGYLYCAKAFVHHRHITWSSHSHKDQQEIKLKKREKMLEYRAKSHWVLALHFLSCISSVIVQLWTIISMNWAALHQDSGFIWFAANVERSDTVYVGCYTDFVLEA